MHQRFRGCTPLSIFAPLVSRQIMKGFHTCSLQKELP